MRDEKSVCMGEVVVELVGLSVQLRVTVDPRTGAARYARLEGLRSEQAVEVSEAFLICLMVLRLQIKRSKAKGVAQELMLVSPLAARVLDAIDLAEAEYAKEQARARS